MGSPEVQNTPLVTQFVLPVGFSRPKVLGSSTALEVPGGIAAAGGDSGAVSTLNYGKGLQFIIEESITELLLVNFGKFSYYS